MDDDEAVSVGRAALREARWDDALAAFEAALATHESPEALDGLAEVRHWQGDYASAIDLRERAFAGFRARGETRYPARLAAYHLAFDYVAVHGNYAAASGWLERGRRLAAQSGDCLERGWVELACAPTAVDLDAKERHVAAAKDIAVRFGDSDLEFDALAYEGVCHVERGHIDEGMRRLDEAAAAVQGGEVRSHTAAGEIFCKMLMACEMVLDVRRAEQWTDEANSLGRRSNVPWASAICRMHYGGILTAAGRWIEAEDTLAASVRIYDGSYRALRSGSVVRLADLRVRQWRLQEAEHLLDGSENDAYAVQPLARLHLARGEIDVAAMLLRRHISQYGEGVLAAPVLALLAEVHVAGGQLEDARMLCLRLVAIAERAPIPLLRGYAASTAGIVSRDELAIGHFETALAAYVKAGLPLEEGRTRLNIARLLRSTQADLAIAEAKAALAVFDRLGAARDADAAAAVLRSLGAKGRTGPKDGALLSRREQEVLVLLGSGLSNPEIALRLFISRKTASHHVSSVLTKLGLRNRAEAAAYAASRSRESSL